MVRAIPAFVSFAVAVAGCADPEPAPESAHDAPGTPPATSADAATNTRSGRAQGTQLPPLPAASTRSVTAPATGPWREIARIGDERIIEVSGVAASRRHPGMMWVHNDSGDRARIFAIDASGTTRATIGIDGPWAIDWEDIAAGPSPTGTGVDLYIADIGDNLRLRPGVQLHRLLEPALRDARVPASTISLHYADGASRDAEALFVDPRTGDAFVVSKEPSGAAAQLFRASRATLAAGEGPLDRVGVLPLTTPVTAADISPDGSLVLVRTSDAVHAFARTQGRTMLAALQRPVDSSNAIEAESVAFIDDGAAWVTIPEGSNAPVMRRG